MILEIEQNGSRRAITSVELFEMAAQGKLQSESKLWVDGVETFCGNVKDIVFGPPAFLKTPTVPPVASVSPNAPVSPAGAAPQTPSAALNDNATLRQNARVRTPYVDYLIGGGSTPYLICYLEAGRSVYSTTGGRVWMKGPIETQNNAQGGFLKSLGRIASGESFFMSSYRASGPAEVAFSTNHPGVIVARELNAGESVVCQRGAFLAATPGVELSVFYQKKIRVGFFGGEGFIMQRATGPGVVFLELAGAAVTYELAPGEKMTCDTGSLAWMDHTCSIDIEVVKGVKNIVFGGEGLFNTIVTGPGRVTFQSMSIPGLAGELAPFFPRNDS